MLFSVVIPSFNRAALLCATLNSVFAQRFTEYEVIVVDDGSTDQTMESLQAFSRQVTTIRQANQGPGAARNRGARQAIGTYLAFLDSDDLWFPWTLEIYRKTIHEHDYPSFITSTPFVFSDDDELTNVCFGTTKAERYDDFLASCGLHWWGCSAFVIHEDAFRAAGGFTDEWVGGQDADLTLRLGTAPGYVHITAPVTFAYRNHAMSLKHDLKRMYSGTRMMVRAESEGNYPGGALRSTERRRILTRHTRPVTLICRGEGLLSEAWMLYRATFWWNASLGRLKYLVGFPMLAISTWTRRLFRRRYT